MKINLQTSRAKDAISTAAAIISTKTLSPQMSNVLLRTEKDALSVYAANDSMTVLLRVVADVYEAGAVTLPGRRVASICGELVGDTVTMASPSSGARVTLTSASSRYTINAIPPSDYQSTPHAIAPGTPLRVKQAALATAIQEVAMAMSKDESRSNLQGIYFEWKGEMLTLVATDGRRLVRSALVVETKGDANFIVPSKAISFLQSVIGKGADVTITTDARAAVFVADSDPSGPFSGPITVTLRLIEGKFPAYQAAIPATLPVSAVVRREEMLAALKRASLICTPKHSAIALKVSASGIQITVKNPETGESDEEVPVASMSGETVLIRLNPLFLIENLASLAFDEVCLQFKNAESPLKIEVGDRYTGVIMPVRLE